MSDHGAITQPHDASHDAVRDALPALLHGRVSASARADLERHLAGCPACDAEFRLLAAVRDLHAAPPLAAVSVDRIAVAVRARTVATPVGTADRETVAGNVVAPRRNAGGSPLPSRAPAWARRGAVRAFAATALLTLGSGAILLHHSTVHSRPVIAGAATPTGAPAAGTPSTVAARVSTASSQEGSLLGANFSDLSDAELAAVVAAVDDPASATPAAEPASVAPTGLGPDGA